MQGSKKAQEELVGFVLIMVVVAVIFLVFLGIFVRKGPNQERTESVEIAQFLDSVVEYTTECSLNGGYSYKNLGELIDECQKGTYCPTSDEDACVLLSRTLENLVEASWNFANDNPEEGFILELIDETGRFIIPPAGRACSPTGVRGADKPITTKAGKVTINLEIC